MVKVRHFNRKLRKLVTSTKFLGKLVTSGILFSLPTTIIPNLDTVDAADVVHQIIWGRKWPKHQRSGPKEIALTLQPSTEHPPVADAYGRHCTAEKTMQQLNVPTIRFQPPRKITTAMLARTHAASPFSHAPQRVWQTNRAFICELETFPWYHRELDPDVVVQIEEERLRKKLLLSFNDRDFSNSSLVFPHSHRANSPLPTMKPDYSKFSAEDTIKMEEISGVLAKAMLVQSGLLPTPPKGGVVLDNAFLAESFRVLKSGGKLGMTMSISPGWLESFKSAIEGFILPPAFTGPFSSTESIAGLVAAAGFTHVDVQSIKVEHTDDMGRYLKFIGEVARDTLQ
ncbi:hypothetical protein DFH08DRAFT_1089349 [Mycena albidolilacea]|uniref:Uncharacterized protein n=1 Tax=Mycena albidolilacea TaxID=1033008 RepID=A0AAD7E8W1_9AGAR|nr:hypothetical protein DFH08DRAFT_1089349 [Mycena albidolilacea]